MARLPRYTIPGQPQHIIQRGNNRQAIFVVEADYQFFRNALNGVGHDYFCYAILHAFSSDEPP
ncbi:MAG: hypothetical protein L0H75_04450, partial [Nitrosospira sp.]|nr:hypothetical protein [Nitrosospira sp.]